jgi:polygalacturonase
MPLSPGCKLLAAFAVILLFTHLLPAQDTRDVREPSIPQACSVLKARIGRAGSSISPDDESKLDTARIQAAMDACPPGHAVVLERASPRLDAFLSGPLDLRPGVVLVVSPGTFLFASRNPRDYDRTPGVCGTITRNSAHGCKALINGEGAGDSGIMGGGVIDGRGGETMIGGRLSWWNLADLARKAGDQNNPRLIQLDRCNNFVLYGITLRNSPNFHLGYENGNGFTAWGVKIWSPERARNTDGIDPGNSTNVTIAHCYIHTGDDQVAIKAGAGAPTSHMSIIHNHFYSGHGMSIGSATDGGASDILVSDLTIDQADNGFRIKSNATRGGLVHHVTFQNVCIRSTENPIVMDTNYSAAFSRASGRIPVFRDIFLKDVRIEGPGKVTLDGYDAAHRLDIHFDNVTFSNPAAVRLQARDADIQLGPGPFNLQISGRDVHLAGSPGAGQPLNCSGRFPDFPTQR